MPIRSATRARPPLALGAILALPAAGLVWWLACANGPRDVASAGHALEGAREADAAPAASAVPAVRLVASTPVNYAKLDPASFVLTPASFSRNPAYGEAMLLSDCENHAKTRDELRSEDNLRAIRTADPSGQLLARLRFEDRVTELQCMSYGEQDYARVPSLMAAAAQQGDPQARAWVLDKSFDGLNEKQDDASLDDPARAALLDQARSMLPEARSLAQSGQRDAALVASRLLGSDRFGMRNIAESARWLLVALQMPGRGFDPRPEVFDDEPYRDMTADEVDKARAEARQVFERCCHVPAVDQSKLSPFSH